MNAELKLHVAGKGRAKITLSLPADKARVFFEAIRSLLPLAGLEELPINSEGEKLISASEVFPDASPAKALRGLRVKEDITQAQLAERLGISQNKVSEMESGKRNISTKMAKKIGERFEIPYKIFL